MALSPSLSVWLGAWASRAKRQRLELRPVVLPLSQMRAVEGWLSWERLPVFD